MRQLSSRLLTLKGNGTFHQFKVVIILFIHLYATISEPLYTVLLNRRASIPFPHFSSTRKLPWKIAFNSDVIFKTWNMLRNMWCYTRCWILLWNLSFLCDVKFWKAKVELIFIIVKLYWFHRISEKPSAIFSQNNSYNEEQNTYSIEKFEATWLHTSV